MKYSISFFYCLFILCLSTNFGIAQNKTVKLLCEYKLNPIGIEVEKPRLSWQIITEQNNVKQTAYEIRVALTKANLTKAKQLLWTSQKTKSDQSAHVEYQGPALSSMQRAYWQVRIWDNKNNVSEWSEVAFWEMGLLKTAEWTADWITKTKDTQEEKSLPAQYYRKEFRATKKIKRATVYVTSLGLYQLFINGNKVGNDLFTPGYTSYHKRLQYQTYVVTEMLQQNNTIGAIVGDGWYRGFLGWKGERSYYGKQLGLLVQLEIEYTDGKKETITTNNNWKTAYGPILESDIYNGEIYDAQLEMNGWSTNGFDDAKWVNAGLLDYTKEHLVSSPSPAVKAIETIKPIALITTPKGETVLDLGQNIVGWVRMKVQGEKGHQVTLQFAEVLDKEGNFFTTNLRAAKATDTYILKGEGIEVFEPHFTFHGFRYVKVENYPEPITKDKITGVVIHSDIKPTGTFTCSDTLINKLQKNIQWSQKDNFLDIPTDCPQRDERVGWTGDAQAFSPTAAFNFDVAGFFTKWLRDLAADQFPNGAVPNVIPDMLKERGGVIAKGGATGWADAAVIVPWTVYQAYGDERILEEQYASMKGWVDFMKKKAGEDYLWNTPKYWHWGDWLAFNTDKPDYAGSVTEKDLIATAYFYHSTNLLRQSALVIGKKEDAAAYQQLAKNIKSAFANEYITPNGRLVSHTQTAYALALSFDLIPTELIDKSAQYFAADVEKFGHLTTGFLGTPLLCSTLSKIGRDDLAFMLLNRKEYPSWLYPVTQGATTIWERWDTQKPDGTIIEGMNSFNHYAYGAIGEWIYSYVAGLSIDPQSPGYKNTIFQPHPGGGLTNANAEFLSNYGLVKSFWTIKDRNFNYNIEIPANTTGTVILPNAKLSEVTLNSIAITTSMEVQQVDNQVILELGSGKYQLKYPMVVKD
jgi:alpha-L-rhamnosidase